MSRVSNLLILAVFFATTVLFVATALGGVVIGSLVLAVSCALLAVASFFVFMVLLDIVRG